MKTPKTNLSTQPAPYHLKVSGGYRGLNLNGKRYQGGQVGIEAGQSFPHQKKTQGFITGEAHLTWLAPQNNGATLKTTGFGIKGGLQQKVGAGSSLRLWGSLGTEIFAIDRVNPESEPIPVSLENASGLSLSAGLSVATFKETLSLEGGLQGALGIPGTPQSEYPWPVAYSSLSWFIHAGLDVAKLVSIKRNFAKPNGEKFSEGLVAGAILDSSYTHNFNQPADGLNASRIFDTAANRPMGNLAQLSLVRPADDDAPVGFGIVLDMGENANVSQASDSFSGNYLDLQQVYTELHLSLGKGLILQVGKIPTIIGLELIEPTNNQISRSWGFGLAIPFTHGGALASYNLNNKVEIDFGLVNGWDNLYNRNTGISGLWGVFVTPKDWASFSVTGATGLDQSTGAPRLLNVVDGIVSFSGGKRFPMSLTLNGDWGHQGEGGEDSPKANWVAASINPRVDFHHHVGVSARLEDFYDPQGVRTGAAQNLIHGAATLHLKPMPQKFFVYLPLEIRAEFRRDGSQGAAPFFRGEQSSNRQNTLAVSATINFSDIKQMWRKEKKSK